MNKIKSINEIPKLFNIKKYEAAKHFDAEQWHKNLMMRKVLSEKYISLGIPEDMGEHIIARYSPETSVKNINKLLNSPLNHEEIEFPSNFELGDIEFDTILERDEEIITSLSKREAFNFYRNLSIQQQQLEKFYDDDFFDRATDQELRKELKLPIHNDHVVFNTERFMNVNIFGDETYKNMAYARVNLETSTNIAGEMFKIWFEAEKKRYFGGIKDKQFTSSDFSNWHNNSVLPYLDLTIWAEINNVTIPHRIMGEAIFSRDKQVDVTESARKTTTKNAQMLMSTGLPILKAQIKTEIYKTKPES